MAGRAKENLPGGSLKYLFVYSNVRRFKRSYRMYIYTLNHYMLYIYIYKEVSWELVVSWEVIARSKGPIQQP